MIVRQLDTPKEFGSDILTHAHVVNVVNDTKRGCFRTVFDLGVLDHGVFKPLHRFENDIEDTPDPVSPLPAPVPAPAPSNPKAYTDLAKALPNATKDEEILAHLESCGKISSGIKVTIADPVMEP